MDEKPAVLGNKPMFDEPVYILRPPISKYSKVIGEKTAEILETNMVTNHVYVKELEATVESRLGAKCAGLSSATSGLMLSVHALGLRNTEVLVPSFTFCATAHAAHWNGCKIGLVDCDEETYNISVEDLKEKITPNTKAVMPVHIFGNPCEIKAISEIAEDHKLKVIYDSAHALGSTYNGDAIGGFGDVEVFSCSPTKLLSTMEGGLLTSNNSELIDEIKLLRNYGSPADYNCPTIGINARMPEVCAALGIEMFKDLDVYVKNRNAYAEVYKEGLKGIPGLGFQKLTENSTTTYKDFTILVNEQEFGMNRDVLLEALSKEKIGTKKYFYPAMHMMDCYKELDTGDFKATENVSNNILALPIYNIMDDGVVENICKAIDRIQKHSKEVKDALSS